LPDTYLILDINHDICYIESNICEGGLINMKLYEIPENGKVTITVSGQNTTLIEYSAIVQFQKQQILFFEPIMQEDKIVDFDDKEIRIVVTYVPQDEMPVVWNGCTLKFIILGGEAYHILYSANEGKHINRRNTYRQFVGENGVLQLGPNKKAVDVIVRDVSVTGLSFVAYSEYDMEEFGLFHLQYLDKELSLNVQISGHVVRMEKTEDERFVYGCKIVESNFNLGKYISYKQIKEAERRHYR